MNRKPNYEMASELPLVLHDSSYRELDFNYEFNVIHKTYGDLMNEYKAAVAHLCRVTNQIEFLKECDVRQDDVRTFIDEGLKVSDSDPRYTKSNQKRV